MLKTTILELVEKKWERSEVNFQNSVWRKAIPSSPGWYFFETNMPPDELKQVGGPKGRHHYNIPERVRASLVLQNFQACILPEHISSFYVIYFGEAANLKARAREHISGHDETGCLALGNYSKLHRYKWYFSFSLLPFEKRLKKDKLVRVVGEQLWRAKHGWPILCAE